MLRVLLPLLAILCLPANGFAQSQVRVVWQADPAHGALIAFTSGTAKPAEVVWDPASHALAAEYGARATTTSVEADDSAFEHYAIVTGLQPDSEVHFRVVAQAAASQDYWFKTAPNDATPFGVLYGGDSRSDSSMRRTMNGRMRDLVIDDSSIVALAHGGDYVTIGNSWSQWRHWLDDWQETVGPTGRVLPIIPARGNHDGDGKLFNKVFGSPGSNDTAGNYYVTRIGQDFAIVTLDSNVSQGGVQRDWLDATLRGLQDTRWLAVNYHRPAYPAVKSPGAALQHWVPLFEQYNVDVVLESDGHVLKRTVPIRSDHPSETGVVYVGEGGLGVGQRTPDLKRWYLQPPGMAVSGHHVQLLRITRDKIFYSAVDGEGEVLDRYDFEPKRLGHAGESPATVQTLPVGKPQPPRVAPPEPQCATTRGYATSGAWLLIACGLFLVRRRSRVWLALVLLATGCVDDPCRVDVGAKSQDVHAVGDSVLWWNGPYCQSIPDLVGVHVFGRVRNSAIAGARLTTTDEPIDQQYVSGPWDLVIVDGGGNDLNGCGCAADCDSELRTLAAEDGSVGAMLDLVDLATDDGAQVVILGYYNVSR